MRIRRRQDAGLGELRRAERIVELRYRVFLRAVQRRELLRIGVGDFLKHEAELLDVVELAQCLDLAGAVARLRADIAAELAPRQHALAVKLPRFQRKIGSASGRESWCMS